MPESRLVELMLGRKVERAFPPAEVKLGSTEIVCDVKHLSSPPRLSDVSLQVSRGEILGVGGLQGQGQLQLFLSLFGASTYTGQITVRGKQLRLRRPGDALKAGIVLIPEDRATEGLCLGLSVRDNLSLSNLDTISTLGLISRLRERALIRTAVSQLNITLNDPMQEVSGLSGGNQQKVLLARALAQHPSLLLMYDATRGVDVGTKVEIYRLMRDLCRNGVSILFYSTDVFELSNLADRVVVLHDGEIRADLRGSDITESRIVAASVGGRSEQA
jgi:ribose transport system ATP-binding protein